MLLFEVFTWSALGLAVALVSIRVRGMRLVARAEQLRLVALGVGGGVVGGSLGDLLAGHAGGFRVSALLLAGATAALLLFSVGRLHPRDAR